MKLAEFGFRYRALFPIPFALVILILANPTVNSLIYGSLFIIAGAALRATCLGYLGVKSRDEVPNIANLITAGPYRFTRNPVYIANILIALGFTIFALGGYNIIINIIASIVVVLIYFSFYNFFVIPAEEEFLTQKFGEEYIEYKNSVPRWLINFKKIPTKGRFRILPVLRTEYWTWLIIISIYSILLIKGKILKI
ncbi:MAG: methyltransferase family protein [bacterium]